MDLPVLCLDTCVVLDILRDPARKDVRVHEHEASLALLSAAQSGTALEALVAEQVSQKYLANVDRVQQHAGRSIGALTRQVGKLNALVALYGPSRPVDPGHWKDHDRRSRDAADRWLQVGTTVRETSDTGTFERLMGTAELRIADLSQPQIDVDIDLDDGGDGVALEWRRMQLSDGVFAKGAAGADRIEGRFHGPGHAEAFGTFHTEAYVGAFGAKRQP